jgi:hypothetical protein
LHRCVLQAGIAMLSVFRDGLGCAAMKAAGSDIEVTSDSG